MSEKLRIGYIPLVDATALLVAVDRGFAAAEGLSIELVREVSWSNVRDKLNIGLFDAAHLLSPVAIASSLGLGHVRVPIVVPFNLGINGNAITVSPNLFAALTHAADGDLADPKVSARALARLVSEREKRGLEPLTFGMTFPFSHHNYQLRFWMAAGGIDPDEDVRLVVLPPPYMVESLASGHVDGFCVGAPWNSVAVDSNVGCILHFGCDIMAHVSEKVLAVRERWAKENAETLSALVRALALAGKFSDDRNNHSIRLGDRCAQDRCSTRTYCPHARWQSQDGAAGRDPQLRSLHCHRPRRREPPRSNPGCVGLRTDRALGAGAVVRRFARGGGKGFPRRSLRRCAWRQA